MKCSKNHMHVYPDGEYTHIRSEGPFISTGTKRPPKKGERYLSGSIPAAYKAPNDLSTPFLIARKAIEIGYFCKFCGQKLYR